MRSDRFCPGRSDTLRRMKNPKNVDPPMTAFERLTTCHALTAADVVTWELEAYLREPLPPLFAERLAERAEGIALARPRELARWFGNRQRVRAFMRHWAAAALAKEEPALYRKLPDDFKAGRPLPLRLKTRGDWFATALAKPERLRRKTTDGRR